MMLQQEGSQQTDSTYGRYEGEQDYVRQQFETSYQQPQQPGWAGKVYTQRSDNKDVLRLVAMGMALAALVVLAVICLLAFGGTGGWISFCAAGLAIFIIAAVAIDRIK